MSGQPKRQRGEREAFFKNMPSAVGSCPERAYSWIRAVYALDALVYIQGGGGWGHKATWSYDVWGGEQASRQWLLRGSGRQSIEYWTQSSHHTRDGMYRVP
jgi:hypothetical protein